MKKGVLNSVGLLLKIVLRGSDELRASNKQNERELTLKKNIFTMTILVEASVECMVRVIDCWGG